MRRRAVWWQAQRNIIPKQANASPEIGLRCCSGWNIKSSFLSLFKAKQLTRYIHCWKKKKKNNVGGVLKKEWVKRQWENIQSKQSLTRLETHPFQIHSAKFAALPLKFSSCVGGNEFTHIRAPCASATYAVLTEGKIPTTPPSLSAVYINTLQAMAVCTIPPNSALGNK